MMTPIIAAQQVSLAYNSSPVIRQLDFAIQAGEFIGLFGPNGAGKSTLLYALLGLLIPSHGQLTIFGKLPQLGNRKIGYMPQLRSQRINAYLSGRSFILSSYCGWRWGWPYTSRAIQQEIDYLLSLVEASDYADQPYAELSGGQKQRLHLAQALLGNPSILLLDEPLASLDLRAQDKLLRLLRQLQQEHQLTILMSAHDINALANYMDKVLYLANGYSLYGMPQETITSERLSMLYNLPISVIEHQGQRWVLNTPLGSCDGDHAHG